MPIQFGGPGVTPSLGDLVTNEVTLPSGGCWTVPSGRWTLKQGPYTTFQEYDPITGVWHFPGAGSTAAGVEVVFSDGNNYRLANQTGCPVAAVVTGAGSGYTAAPVFTPNTGGSVWKAVLGGAVNTTVTVTNGGVNYTYPPTVLFSAPPPGGVAASGHCTLSAGAVSTIVVDNQGAGYVSPPTVTFVNDPRETSPASSAVTTGSGAAATATLTGAGTVTALLCLDHGTGGQSAVVTVSPASGAATATVIMCWSITAIAVSTTTAGSGYATPISIAAYDNPVTGSVLTNPAIQTALFKGRNAFIIGTALSGTAISPSGISIRDGGVYSAVPTVYSWAFPPGAGAVQATLTPTMGGQTDSSFILQT